jgi:mRNA interferase MazF
VVTEYVPDVGHIIWLTLDPQAGNEQAGRRPFLVLTPKAYNEKTSLVVGCPMRSRLKGYPFEVPLRRTGTVSGVILSDQIKSVDWRERKAAFVEKAATGDMRAAKRLIGALLDL